MFATALTCRLALYITADSQHLRPRTKKRHHFIEKRGMAKWSVVMVVLALLVAHATARNVPTSADLEDQKNFLTYGGLGGFSGIGSNGLPFGRVGGLGGATGLDGNGGLGGGGGLGVIPGGGASGGVGGSSGSLPFP
ncbi:hypothetical protein V6N13_007959 [Hibiscus sabdariffa]|uniref:Glycine-rich protein n=1 Tax=Hibiscus sabdariffa TaxID=183260 RepID=A0ABR2EBW0_9ROSI